jgi:protein-tyrosine phosphatase
MLNALCFFLQYNSKNMLKSINNFRDFGGYLTESGKQIKSGMIFRSGSTDKMSGKDLLILKNLGLKTIIDLRPKNEQQPNTRLKEFNKITLPFDIDGLAKTRTKPYLFKKGSEKNIIDAIRTVYDEMPELLKSQVCELFKLLSNLDSYPLLINCRAGKDRTGFAAVLIQMALGLRENMVMFDYLKSNNFFLTKAEKWFTLAKIISFGKFPVNNIKIILTAYEEYLNAIISRINNDYKGISGYLQYCSVDENEINKLRNLLLE